MPPKIKDLTIKKVWKSLLTDQELLCYFPDPCIEKEPPRNFFFSILSAIRPEVFQSLLKQAESKHLENEESNQNIFMVSQRIMGELNTVNFKYSMLKKKTDKRIYLGH